MSLVSNFLITSFSSLRGFRNLLSRRIISSSRGPLVCDVFTKVTRKGNNVYVTLTGHANSLQNGTFYFRKRNLCSDFRIFFRLIYRGDKVVFERK